VELTLRIQTIETRRLDRLFEMARAGIFDLELLVPVDDGRCYELSLDDEHAAYIFELLDDAIDGRTFESFAGWRRRHRDQLPLKLVPESNKFQLVDGKEA